MKVLFVVTELQRPVGGLYRFAVELLPAWRKAFAQGRTQFEPLVFSMKDPLAPPGDLVPSADFRMPEGVALFEAVRGGEKCYFLESALSQEQLGEFQQKLWETYGVRSMKSASWVFYRQLNAFWKSLPEVYPSVREKHDVALVDCQDWLAYPAGFALKEKFGLPLYCRMHSCEWGRSLGKPDPEEPQLSIEAAALQEADFFQSVSAGEVRFDLYRLLPLKEALAREKPRGEEWMARQAAKEKDYQDFLLTEPRGKAVLVGKRCAGVPNGIILDSWRKITAEDVAAGRAALDALLPGKEKYAFFIGRPAKIKGVYELLDAFARLDAAFGLVMSSSFTPPLFDEFMREIAARGLQDRVALRDGWIDEKLKKQIMCASDVIVLPSLYEPFGIVTLEGLAADLACEANGLGGPVVVVGDTGGMKETVENRVSGLKAPMDADRFELKSELLAGVLSEAFNDAELKRRLSRGGAERVKSPVYDWVNIAETYGGLYARCVKNCRESQAQLK
ncbi:hypothetical protein COX86_01290 [Candidatus Micrarchaeota archaeon CG_4_10_14_0_2_um_filter_60_11]|nr:MAG: hypothetical protein AUJ16_04280 [Candidatus Micrarchaeota archaeon CG1_02_60_51]PIO02065.1 MAG: hypothetical protein COT58_01875 [Candidatus Micrarchaeota archaeon CG09_land_8_20_14_0_10_60_16]PIY91777.1 MAG: hypothetical protein COY71_01330 [Candidatus Micrarchaeota archaeon CG_4_10_14_0_8_um_filter_60_7]PIZ91139.1 MAG: hypothetical protein COX86_01290 [Candidatus Micrarchaeota archaeon CG_4_10_14_0_2_um_filter_60_11]